MSIILISLSNIKKIVYIIVAKETTILCHIQVRDGIASHNLCLIIVQITHQTENDETISVLFLSQWFF